MPLLQRQVNTYPRAMDQGTRKGMSRPGPDSGADRFARAELSEDADIAEDPAWRNDSHFRKVALCTLCATGQGCAWAVLPLLQQQVHTDPLPARPV